MNELFTPIVIPVGAEISEVTRVRHTMLNTKKPVATSPEKSSQVIRQIPAQSIAASAMILTLRSDGQIAALA
jgi:hypothetical protein